MVLAAGLFALLSRLTGRDDLTIGSPIANRNRIETEGLGGFFVNSLVLRADLSRTESFRDLLRQVRESSLGAYAHQDVPFEKLVDELRPDRDLSRSPLFQVSLALQNAPFSDVDLGGARLVPREIPMGVAKFDLSFAFAEAGGRLDGVLEYATDLFDGSTAARYARHLAVLLDALVTHPRGRLAEAPLLTSEERQQVVVEWNEGAVLESGPRCLHHRFEEQADRTPDAVAVSAGEERLTYRELDERANGIAHHLLDRGVRPGDRVALKLDRSASLVAAILGVLKTGAAYVPLDPTYPADRVAFALADSGASVLLTEEDLPPEGGGRLAVSVDPAFPAYVIYTSGSTGRPKGVVVSHANVDRLLTSTEPWFGFGDIGASDVWTLFHSYAFDFSVWEIWGALLHGGRLVVVPQWQSRSPEDLYRLLRDERVTVLNQTPSAFRQLLWAEESVLGEARPELSLRWVIFGGEALDLPSLAPWFARHGDETPRLVNMYGITETTVHVTFRPIRARDLNRGSVIGRPIPDLSAHVLDTLLRPQPIGVPGEIHVGGAGLAQGYLGRPDLTAERFVPDPFSAEPGARLYRSGDLARRLPDGDLEYLGRIDHQVKIRGFRIELGEIEAALARHPGVREAVVLAREDVPGEKRLVGYIVPSREHAVPVIAGLRDFLQESLPEYMIPWAFVELEALPVTDNGKLDRTALPAPREAQAGRTAAAVAPRNDLERSIAAVWREVLHLDDVGVQESFFEVGGSSLLMARLQSRLRQAIGREIPLVELFRHPTVESLARSLEADAPRPEEKTGQVKARTDTRRESMKQLQQARSQRRGRK
ncbi:MAG TPA: amino acid adenylation domain-containing protein, partial [Thermoanaerobaculia bacterium]|nr:amino acid adenylation domain-containing protein [Thermoanaerobaculia bacterium]